MKTDASEEDSRTFGSAGGEREVGGSPACRRTNRGGTTELRIEQLADGRLSGQLQRRSGAPIWVGPYMRSTAIVGGWRCWCCLRPTITSGGASASSITVRE